MDISFWQIGLSSLILIVLFVIGMRMVYGSRPDQSDDGGDEAELEITLRKAWVMFGIASAAVLVAGIFLAWSADQIAEVAGVSSSTIGILAVSFVASLPELSMVITAVRIGAADLAVAAIYGSNVFNISILFYSDLFYRDGILINQTVPSHFIAGGIAIVLMLAWLVLIMRRERISAVAANAILVVMAALTIAGGIVVATLGTTKDDDDGQIGGEHYVDR
jgi:cation:H+ antiporter